jgi:hypothetical protein
MASRKERPGSGDAAMNGDARRDVLLGVLVALVGSVILFVAVSGPLARAAAERIPCGMAQQELAVVLSR